MSLIHTYIDPAKNANSGSGSSISPYGDLQYAFNKTKANAIGNAFHVKSGIKEVLYAPLDLSYFVDPSNYNHFRICGYNTTAFDGGEGEIDCNGFSLIETGRPNFHLCDLNIGNSGSNIIVDADKFVTFLGCRFHTCSNVNMLKFHWGGSLIGCSASGWTYAGASGAAVYFSDATYAGQAHRCFIDTGSVNGAGIRDITKGIITENSIHSNHANAIGVLSDGNMTRVLGNNLYNETAGSSYGVSFASTMDGGLVLDNIIEGWSRPVFTPSSTERIAVCKRNFYFGNTTNSPLWTDLPPVEESSNTTTGSSSLTDPANNNFNSTDAAKDQALVQAFRGIPAGRSINYRDIGGSQQYTSIGGGGKTSV